LFRNRDALYAASSLSPTKVYSDILFSRFLDEIGHHIHILSLAGYLFFGTIHHLDSHIRKVLNVQENAKFRFLILDFRHITGVDYSAAEAFLKLKRLVLSLKVHLLVCGLEGAGLATIQNCGLFDFEEVDVEEEGGGGRWIHIFNDIDEALEWSENMLLQTYYAKLDVIKGMGVTIPSSPERPITLASLASPRKKEASYVAARVLRDEHSHAVNTEKSDLTTTLV
jgi:SulP family sulfate permease